ncbi:MAG TPA: hypothetical protein ENN17_09145 [bacterium]|nr:hypothetical protein [bacterium]
MKILKKHAVLMLGILLVTGCAKRMLVPVGQVEKSNDVEVRLRTGERLTGTVIRKDPHQLVLSLNDGATVPVPYSAVQTIRRKPPVYDNLGKPISEIEIGRGTTHRHATVYGIGGGLLTIGGSFFAGSLIANETDGGAGVIAATVGGGGGLGTFLFLRAGKARDREEAIARIRRERQLSIEVRQDRESELDPESYRERLIEEKQKQEELRREREHLLRELEKTRQMND